MRNFLIGFMSVCFMILFFPLSVQAEEVVTPSAVTVLENAPGQVSGLTAKKASSLKKVALAWSPVSGATGYVIYRKDEKTSFTELARVGANRYEDSRAAAGGTYSYQVYACKVAADGTVLMGPASAAATVSLKPGKVKSLKAKGIRGGISLKWGKTAGISGYQIYMKVFVRVKGIKTKYNLMKVTKSRKYRKKMLVKGMKYGFMVRTYKKVNGKKVYGAFSKVTKRAK